MSVHRSRNRQPNRFGYLTGVLDKKAPCPSFQLQNLLKLGDRPYDHVRASIMDLIVKYMDVKLMGSQQRDKLDAIEVELRERFPDIFAAEESEKKLYFAVRFILHTHAGRHHRLKRQIQAQRTTVPPPKLRITRNQDRNQQSPILEPDQYTAIYDFLQNATPPMTHLVEAFVRFGYINADFLLTISSWSFDKIQGFLDQLPPGPNGREITKMEKFILLDRFTEYFAKL